MVTKTPSNMITITGRVPQRPLPGQLISLFTRGVDDYERLPIGAEIEIRLDDGVCKATVTNSQVGPLIDLIGTYGTQSIYTYGQMYSARALIAAIGGGEVVDVTKLYTALVVNITQPV